MSTITPAVWLPAIRAGSGADVFTQRLCNGLNESGFRAEITWLPLHAEYAPWACPLPRPPVWATIVHVNTWLHRRFIPSRLPVVATMHLVVHDPALRPYRTLAQSLYHRLWIKPIETDVINLAAAVTAVSRYTANRMQEVFGPRPIEVIYNGVDPSCYPEPVRSPPHKPFRLLFVGSWSRRKGADLLGPIMRSLGDGFELRYAGAQVIPSSLPPNCIGLGFLSEAALRQAYLDSDALLFPSRLEGFVQVVIEAMACGLPVVATNASSLPEAVDQGITGLLCPQDQVAAFVEAIKALAADRDKWIQMSSAARTKVLRRFTASQMIEQYVAIYRSLL